MKFLVQQGWEKVASAQVFGVYGDKGSIVSKDLKAFQGVLDTLGSQKVFQGDKGTSYSFRDPSTGVVTVFVGLGSPKQAANQDAYRQGMGHAIQSSLEKEKAGQISIHLGSFVHADAKVQPGIVAQHLVEALLLATYKFTKYFGSDKSSNTGIAEVKVHVASKAQVAGVQSGVSLGEATGNGQRMAMELSMEPANILTPTELANRAVAMAKKVGLKAKVLDKAAIKKERMEVFLSVAQGSQEQPKFIILEYTPKKPSKKTVCLVGKGITFDTGGISIKPSAGMELMKKDMTGAACVIGAMSALKAAEVNHRVIALIPTCDNMPSGSAVVPSAVVKSRKGLTVEIINTDAEGRLILCDALDFAHTFNPDVIIDIATLTGAASVALGNICSALMSNNDKLVEKLEVASQKAAERVWRLPLFEEYSQLMKSEVADVKNSGDRTAGTIYGGKFLEKFVSPDVAWAHLDIAATSWGVRHFSYLSKTASTAIGTRLMIEYLRLS